MTRMRTGTCNYGYDAAVGTSVDLVAEGALTEVLGTKPERPGAEEL